MRGKVGGGGSDRFSRQDHPRLCGEKEISPYFKLAIIGSPPPMRGKEETLKGITGEHGITPAYAGKSLI